MGVKKTLNTHYIITDGAMVGTSVIESEHVNIVNLDNISLQLDWTGNAAGVFDILVSNDDVNYHSLNISGLPAASGVTAGFIVNLNQIPQPYIKVTYTNASGTGTLNATIFAKDVN